MSDQAERRAAVEPGRSVIVQAPAGSGKTTLLVERYLGLLAVVEAPEEILAITFTRKAAAEMRQRILQYLEPGFESAAPHEQAALAKARAVAPRIAEWGLRENPQRMLIRTIDSFNHYLARTMPVASQLGPVPAPADNTRALYRRAARRVLALADGGDALAEDLKCLLAWRDNRGRDIEDLLVGLLARRDQWLRALGVSGTPDRARLQQVLEQVVTAQLQQASARLEQALAAIHSEPFELAWLLDSAAAALAAGQQTSAIVACAGLQGLPEARPLALPAWRGVGEALLTAAGSVRRQVNVRNGFAPKTPEKTRMLELLQGMADDAALAAALDTARRLPEPGYGDQEWAVLAALVRVLERAAAELEMVFAAAGQTDFAGLAAAALRGLGDEESGFTDLGLYLDRRIRHILVDEYQDTNWSQYHLLEKLTAGWQADEGRSLFLVGDPMQSIYRFREAEVGLFMRTRDRGIGGLDLESRRLSRNFRSRAEIVDWVNDMLGPIFPVTEDVSAGAVGYARSEPGRGGGGRVELIARADAAAEGEAVAALLVRALADNADNPDFRAAIIVRARGHLAAIIPALRRHAIRYRAVKLAALTARPVVQDLLALTRAVINPADRAALLAILRSPVCGLTLAQLHALAGDGRDPTDGAALERLDADGRARAGAVYAAVDGARAHWRRRPVRDLVEGAWRRLGGHECCASPATDHADAARYLDALDSAEADGLLDDWNDFTELLDGCHTEGDPPSEAVRVELLTMHGAKGLEWDLVVLPGLNRGTGGNDRELLYWLPFTPPDGDEQVLLAPLRAADQAANPPLVELIRSQQKARDAYEHQRLLYVAATRAREHLVLSACLNPARDPVAPPAGSLLADLWPTLGDAFTRVLADSPDAAPVQLAATAPDASLRRVAPDWRPSRPGRLAFTPALPPPQRETAPEFNWAGMQARRTGTVLHRLLERVGTVGVEAIDDPQRRELSARIPNLLRALGTAGDALDEAAAVVRDAFARTLDSETGRWLLSGRHRDAACELAVSGIIDGRLVNAVIDRCFIDDKGTRWIIDYKSGYHAGGDLQGFLAGEADRYRPQLGAYRTLFEQMGETDIRTALYLPRHGVLEEVT